MFRLNWQLNNYTYNIYNICQPHYDGDWDPNACDLNNNFNLLFEKKNLTMDHIVPKSKKGSSTWDNVVTACITCNLKKGDRNIRPKVEPSKPSLSHLIRGHQIDKNNFPDREWDKYIFQS